ncbi:MAG: GNAT family N-acetyltransferase [Oscillospiraceae bacterium]|nr:GNAT family N-acetyltransferase [Oscillospiraceae bacterium]
MKYFVADENNLDDLVNIRIEYIRAELGNLSMEDEKQMMEKLPEYFRNHLNKDCIAFLAECDEKVVGSAFLHIIEKPCRPQYKLGRIGEVLNVVTLEEYRNLGIATELMKNLINYAKRMNMDYIELKATKAGKAIYENIGFYEIDKPYINMKYMLL